MYRATIFFALLLSVASFCKTKTVLGLDGDLRAALQAARPGDTILVNGGKYVGNFILDRRLILIGRGKPIVRGEGTGSIFTLAADSCVIRGFVIEHSGNMLVDEDAGILVKSNGNLIEENELRDILFGIYLYRSSRNIIRRNVIQGRNWLELGQRGSGIHIWNSRDNTLVDNIITDARDGMYIQNANGNQVDRNEIYNLRYGLHYMYSDSNRFTENQFHHNMAGAAIMYSSHLTFRRNAFVHNRGVSSFGILFQDCHYSLADSNIIADNDVGLFFEASGHNTFRYNTIAQNDLALQMYTNSEENVFTLNAFVDNVNPLRLVGKQSTTLWSYEGKGNYWSQHDSYDFNNDGIADIPLRIQNAFDYLEGNYPRLRLYLYSPASQALEVAVRAFPFVEISREIDDHPLLDRPEIPAGRAVFSNTSNISVGSVLFVGGAMGGAVLINRLRHGQGARRKGQ